MAAWRDGKNRSFETEALHADDDVNGLTDVAPPIHVSTTFQYSHEAENLVTISDGEVRWYP